MCSLLSISGPSFVARIEDAPLNRNWSVATCIPQRNSCASRSNPRMLSKPVEVRYRRALVDRDLVAMLEIRIAPGAERAGSPACKRTARRWRRCIRASPSKAMPRRPRSQPRPCQSMSRPVPVERLPHRAPLEIDQVYAAVALALVTATDDRGRDELHFVARTRGNAGMGVSPCPRPSPFLGERQTDRARPLQRADETVARIAEELAVIRRSSAS